MKTLVSLILFVSLSAGPGMAAELLQFTLPPDLHQSESGEARGLGPHSITQSLDTATILYGGLLCGTIFYHRDSSYIRRFFLNTDHAINKPYAVTSVSFGVLMAVSNGSTQPLTVNLYSIPKASPLTFANLTLIGTATENDFPYLVQAIATIDVAGVLIDPWTHDLVVEIFTPDGEADSSLFVMGNNNGGEIRPSYMAAPDCSWPEPVTLASKGYPAINFLMIVNGAEQEPIPTADEWGMMILAAVLGLFSLAIMRQRTVR
ncbi:MAG: hypothetical protein V1793_00020 [Pseudomonadota bacterium]